MKSPVSDASFVREVQFALKHIYDPVTLGQSALVKLLGIGEHAHPAAALQTILTEAIEALRPDNQTPPQAEVWRFYHLLSQRYVEQFPQQDIALNLTIGQRQLRRLHLRALQALADLLWCRYDLKQDAVGIEAGRDEIETATQATDAVETTREQELEWLKQSVPKEPVDLASLIQTILAIVNPLAERMSVRVNYALPGDASLPMLAVQLPSVRHALLSALSIGVRKATGGAMQIAVQTQGADAVVCIKPCCPRQAAATPLSAQDMETLKMARELLALSSGSLELDLIEHNVLVGMRVALPMVEQIPVLVIDDNADALQLFQRYLANSSYRFIGLRDPSRAMALAQETQPRIIVLDLMLPHSDGWELLGRFRELPGMRDVPVIICTILPQQDLALALGAAALLRKPVSREQLLMALDQQIGPTARRSC